MDIKVIKGKILHINTLTSGGTVYPFVIASRHRDGYYGICTSFHDEDSWLGIHIIGGDLQVLMPVDAAEVTVKSGTVHMDPYRTPRCELSLVINQCHCAELRPLSGDWIELVPNVLVVKPGMEFEVHYSNWKGHYRWNGVEVDSL